MKNIICIACLFITWTSCDSNKSESVTSNDLSKQEQVAFEFNESEVSQQLDAWIDSTDIGIDLPQIDEDYFSQSLYNFYDSRKYKPAWTISTSNELIKKIKGISLEGLDPEDYPISRLEELHKIVEEEGSSQLMAELDLLHSATYLKLADVIASGKVKAQKISSSWHIRPDKPENLEDHLKSAIKGNLNNSLNSFRPKFKQYDLLIGELPRLRGIIKNGGWPKVQPEENLSPGDSSREVYNLKKRLQIAGDLESIDEENQHTYDSSLIDAINRFQERHGLDISPVVGPNTLEALNISASDRLKQIMLNIDRIRWLASGDLPDTYVMVNIPEYRLQVVENGKDIKEMKVVVGEVMNTTPIFSDYIEYAVFSPYWNIPESIAKKEVWPYAKGNPGYFRERNYEVLTGWGDNGRVIDPDSIQWDENVAERYRVRQKPGPKNSLGLVKYMFPNEFAIYLHDTPADHLFAQDKRAFSHGCIRMEDPVWFGDWLFPQYTKADIRRKMNDGERDVVNTDQHIPVFILYLTAFVNDDGRLNFRNDLYELDKSLLEEFEKT